MRAVLVLVIAVAFSATAIADDVVVKLRGKPAPAKTEAKKPTKAAPKVTAKKPARAAKRKPVRKVVAKPKAKPKAKAKETDDDVRPMP